MTKFETITFEYEYCSECPHCEWIGNRKKIYCIKIHPNRRMKGELWEEIIPDWCPLPDKGK